MRYIYQARFEPDPDGGFLVSFPDVPEAITWGEDDVAAIASAADALAVALRGYAKDGRDLPTPTVRDDADLRLIAVPVDDAMKLSVIEAFRASGISKVELAARLGKGEKEARRILDPDYPSGLPILTKALSVLGMQAVVEVAAAA